MAQANKRRWTRWMGVVLAAWMAVACQSPEAPTKLSDLKALTAFTFASPSATGTVTEATHTVAVTVPFGTNRSALTPSISITGATVSPASGVARNFTSPVTYTVTAADGSTQNYVVTVTAALSDLKALTAFTFASPSATGNVTEVTHTVAVTVPFGTDLSALTPSISITGTSISPASGVARNFTNPVTYTVTAADGSTQNYVVTVTAALSDLKALTAFTFASPSATGTVTEATHTVAVTVPFGTNRSALTPSISITGTSISPASGVARNFTNPVTYTVTAADGSTQNYVVTVTAALSDLKALTAFTFASPSATGTVTEATHTVAVTVPFGTNLSALTPSISITGATVSPASGVTRNFTNPVTYTVTAADGSTQNYVVTIAATGPGAVWTTRTMPGNLGWSSVTHGNGTFVAVASDSDAAATSPDGITWTARTLPSTGSWFDVTYGNGIFVAVGYSNVAVGYPALVATSPDGMTWTPQTLPSDTGLFAVTYGKGGFVAITGGTSAATSPDGDTWTTQTIPQGGGYGWVSVAYGNGVFVAVAWSSGEAATLP